MRIASYLPHSSSYENHRLVLNLSQSSQTPVKLQLSPKDTGVVHIVCTKMLYVTVCYVCCICYRIPVQCHWCCCFRYIRNSFLFFSFSLFGLNPYIILYILRSSWVQEHTNVVSRCLFLNVRFLCVRLFVFCAFNVLSPFTFDMSNCRGKT